MKILYESLHDFLRFTEKGDPIKDMGIGIEKLIHTWIQENGVVDKQEYYITSNKHINTYNTAIVNNLNITELPEYINFYYVMGGFHIDHNKLTTLRGCPVIVSGSFICSWNELANLVDSPLEIKGSFIASHNKLISLKGLPKKIEGTISISNNNLKNLKGIPNIVHEDFYIHKNPLETLEYFPDKVVGDLYYSESWIINEESIKNRCKVGGMIINKQ